MSNDYRFGLVVAVEGDGSLVRAVEKCGSKYDAAKRAQELAKVSPGVLYVSMDCHEAYRSEPRVEQVWLEIQPQRLPDVLLTPASSVEDL